MCSGGVEAPQAQERGEQERVRCVAGGHAGRAEEHTARPGRGWASLRWDFVVQAEVRESLEIREQESRPWGA